MGSDTAEHVPSPDEWEKSHKRKLDPGPPGGSAPKDGDLAHEEEDKRRIAGYIYEVMGPKTHTAGGIADGETEDISGNPQSPTTSRGELHGWETWAGVRHRLTKWREHHKTLIDRLLVEHGTLLDVNKIFAAGEDQVTQGMTRAVTHHPKGGRPPSALDVLSPEKAHPPKDKPDWSASQFDNL
ncbi:hypothetical protein [Streptomyces sp. NPDC006784]|uniref:hypothetical protein n=1 Tax=Streptomyces sp. NPDC006784 TaxID=3364764 RepID=UPI0036A53C17